MQRGRGEAWQAPRVFLPFLTFDVRLGFSCKFGDLVQWWKREIRATASRGLRGTGAFAGFNSSSLHINSISASMPLIVRSAMGPSGRVANLMRPAFPRSFPSGIR